MRQKLLLWSAIFVAFVFSCRLYSAWFFPWLDSDMAIHVLMINGFEFHHSLYFWAQTRLGSLVPFLGFFPWKLGADPLLAYSLIQYGLIAIGLVLFWLIFDRLWAVLFTSILFLFPPFGMHFTLMPGHPYLPHFVLTLMVAATLEKTRFSLKSGDLARFSFLLMLVSVSIWVTELTLVTVPIMILWCAAQHRIQNQERVAFGLLSIASFLYLLFMNSHLKEGRVDYSGYHMEVAEITTVITEMQVQAEHLCRAFKHLTNGPWAWAYTVVLVVLTCYAVFALVRHRRVQIPGSRWYWTGLFLLLSMATWGATLFSGWASASEYPQRYFSLSVLLFVLGLVNFLISLNPKSIPALFLLALLSATGVASYFDHTPPDYRFIVDAKAKTRLGRMQNSTIIGDYWNCYAMAAYNGDNIYALPFDGQFTRNGHQLYDALAADSIFVCVPASSQEFPDTLKHYYGHLLTPENEPSFSVGNTSLKRYKVIARSESQYQ